MTNYTPAADSDEDAEGGPRLWNGLIGFAAFMLVLQGAFHVLGGFIALLEDNQYAVPSEDLMISIDYTWWGIAHMALGVGMVLASYALFWGRTWGRVFAIVVAMVSAVTNLAFLSANPVWYTLMIAVDLLVIYAVTVHGADREY